MSKKKPYPDIEGHLKAIRCGFKYLATDKRITIMYPEVTLELPQSYRGMIMLDINKCIQCGLCARICPSNAIKMYKRDEKKNPGINYSRCIYCGFCVDICPVDALKFTDVHDTAYYTLEDLEFCPEKLSKKPEQFKKPKRKVKVVFDERKGLKYE
jgi:NADH-quinone oxidoreductase subunit I